jgi:hypothetical protein
MWCKVLLPLLLPLPLLLLLLMMIWPCPEWHAGCGVLVVGQTLIPECASILPPLQHTVAMPTACPTLTRCCLGCSTTTAKCCVQSCIHSHPLTLDAVLPHD